MTLVVALWMAGWLALVTTASGVGREAPLIVGLCITGQLGRLEVRSKVEAVLKHAASSNHVVDVVLAVHNSSRSESVFVNSGMVQRAMNSQTSKAYARSMARQDLEFYSRYYRESFVESMSDALLNMDYVEHLDKTRMNSTQKEARGRSHISQWYHMSRCWKEFEALEYEQQFRYDSFLRLRDDAYVLAPMDLSAVVSLSNSKDEQVIIVPHCESSKKDGINDKAALVNRAAAHNYFVSLLDYYYLRWDVMKTQRKSSLSPERFINWCYAARGIRIVKSSQAMPIMTSVLISGTSADEERHCIRVKGNKNQTSPNTLCYYKDLPNLQSQIKSMMCTS